jgi:hypothetical protein
VAGGRAKRAAFVRAPQNVNALDDPVRRKIRLLAVALEHFLTGRTQLLPVLPQALLNRRVVAQLLPAKAGSVARACLLLLGSSLLS